MRGPINRLVFKQGCFRSLIFRFRPFFFSFESGLNRTRSKRFKFSEVSLLRKSDLHFLLDKGIRRKVV